MLTVVPRVVQTLTLPKPLVEFGNKPMIVHQIEALVAAGVRDIVLAVNYRPEIMEKFLAEVCWLVAEITGPPSPAFCLL